MLDRLDIGIRYLGKADAIGKEAVYTAILVVGIPLLPLGSWYGVRSGGRGEHINGRRIRLHPKSLILAYLRKVFDIQRVVAAACPRLNLGRNRWTSSFLAVAGELKVVYLFVLRNFDKSTRLQRQQRLLLAHLVDTTVDPNWLPKRDVKQIMAKLRPTLEALQLPIDPRHWQMYAPEPDLAPFVYAMARYMRPLSPAADWQIVANRAWSQFASEVSTAAASPSLKRTATEPPLLLTRKACW